MSKKPLVGFILAPLGHNWFERIIPFWTGKVLPKLLPSIYKKPSTIALVLGALLLDSTLGELIMNMIILTAFGVLDTGNLMQAIDQTKNEIIEVYISALTVWPAA